MNIRKANIDDLSIVVSLLDTHMVGYGFVTSAQIKTEIKKGSVWVAEEIVGIRVGTNRVYNLLVHPDYRRRNIATGLITLRCTKSIPIFT